MAQGNVATPFLEMPSFVSEEIESFAAETPPRTIGSPFISVYELDGQSEYTDPERETYASFVQDLYDEEFDEALYELMIGARGLHEEQLVSSGAGADGERLLRQHFSQLVREAEAAVSAFEREFGSRDPGSLAESEVDAFADRYAPASALEPEFEEFLGKWKKKLAGVVKKAAGFVKKGVKFAAKLGLGPVLNKIKALVKPMLEKVLQMAIGRLPEAVRPAAQQLAARLFGTPAPEGGEGAAAADSSSAEAAPAADAGAVQASAGPDVTDVQQELDQQLANLFLASDEVEMELEVARARGDERQASVPAYADLDRAREHFIDELQNLSEGEDAAPHIQNFIPAILPALKLGMKLIGRPKVVGFLANLLGKVIGKLIGPEAAPALSRAIVDAGLKLLTLEVAPQDEQRVAASSVAATVEETARRISALPDYVLDNQELLEGFALEAFEQAAAANLPPVLSEAVYRERPDLLESRSRTAWVMLPLRRRKRYKKCARTFRVRITPHMAEEIESFEGPLADYLSDQLGIEEGAEVEAEVHLYETLPGTLLPDIAREEAETMKAGQLHPLTRKAAGLLLGEPRMGRMLPELNRRNVGVGVRLYSLAIPGKRILTVPGADGKPRSRRLGGVRVALDATRDEIRVCIFLSEVKAQRLALRLRRQSHPGSLAAAFQKYLAPRLAPVLHGARPERVRLIHAGMTSGAALRRLPADAATALSARLSEALVTAFAEFAKTQSQRIVAASEDTADGITIRFTIARPAGLQQLFKALQPNGHTAGVADALLRGSRPDVRIEVVPGYQSE
ncbi:MAG TPA: hypothetical protein VF266_15865 [Thermoanaerobaculia bacterium]